MYFILCFIIYIIGIICIIVCIIRWIVLWDVFIGMCGLVVDLMEIFRLEFIGYYVHIL